MIWSPRPVLLAPFPIYGGAAAVGNPGGTFGGFLRPDSDINTSNWSSTPLWQKLDETSPDDSTTEITSSTIGQICSGGDDGPFDFECGFTNPSTPPNGFETVRVRVRAWLDPAASGSSGTFTVQLKETATVHVTYNFSANTGGYTTNTKTLTRAEVQLFSGSWNNFRMNVSLVGCNTLDFETSAGKVTWLEVEFIL